MFSLFRSNNTSNEVHRVLRRIVERSSPNLPSMTGEARDELRSNRTLPVLLVPEGLKGWSVDHASFAVTKNISSQGLALVTQCHIRARRLLVAFWSENAPVYLDCETHHCVSIGGDFWQLGLKITQVLGRVELPLQQKLEPLAARLSPDLRSEMAGLSDLVAQ